MQEKSVAIDGPAGAGKSTLARALARELGYLYVDTGAIYRTVALRAWEAGADPSDPEQIAPLLKGLDLRMDYGADGVQRMYLSGRDVTEAIRVHQISGLASQVAALPPVRDFLLDFQRRQAMEHDVVMDGRDIGTVVLPPFSGTSSSGMNRTGTGRWPLSVRRRTLCCWIPRSWDWRRA